MTFREVAGSDIRHVDTISVKATLEKGLGEDEARVIMDKYMVEMLYEWRTCEGNVKSSTARIVY